MKKYTMTGIVLVVLLLGMSTAVAYDSPTLVTYTITNTTIEPPQTTSIDVAFSEYVSAIIKIENASGNLVKELYSNSDVKNPTAKIWDGTYTDGTSVPDGTYTVNVTGVNTTTGLSVINTSETITVVTIGDTTPPTVTANMPTGTDVPISTVISVTFDEAMNQTSAEDAFSITPDVDGSLGWDNDTMTFTPDADLAYDTTYNVTVGTGAEDLAGNNLEADFVWNFTTVAEADTTPPTVDANTPTGTDVAISTTITATFSEAMNQTSAEDVFSISPAVTGTLSWTDNTTTFTPDGNLAYETTYNVTIGTGAEDLAGNPLAEDFTWNFTTGSPTATDTVTRTLPATASPNDTIMVSLAIDFVDQAAINRLVITETVPDGWAIVDASDSGNLDTAGKITWMFITAIGGTIPEDGAVFTYNVTVPTDASGLYSFSGVYGTNVAGTGLDILGDVNVTIDGNEPPTLVTYTITNRTITPPQTTSIDVAFSEYVSATIKIENASGSLVKELYSNSDVKNPDAKTWNGTYTDGTSVPDDTYTVNVTGVNTTTGLSVINTSETITVVTSGDTTPPTVTANMPTGTDVSVSTAISVTFSEAMNTTSAEDAFSITPDVNGSLSWTDDTMTFTPGADLAYVTKYEATIGTGAEDLAGNNLEADFVWNFTTEEEADTTAPTVTANTPTGTGVLISTAITATFSEAMNTTSAEDAFSITPDVAGTLSWTDDTMTFTPDGNLAYSTIYEVTIGTGAEDLADNSLEAPFVWNFTTEEEPVGEAPTILGATLSPNAILSDGVESTELTVQASSGIGIASVTVNLSAIGGPDEQALDGTPVIGTGTWKTTFNTTSEGTFDLTVTVTDDDDNSATAEVTLTAGPHKYTLELKQGWNMVSLPYNIAAVGIDTTQKLGDLVTNAPDAGIPCYYVARFNATSQTMECDLISPPEGMPQDTTYPIVGGQAYFVFVGNDKDVDVVGTLW